MTLTNLLIVWLVNAVAILITAYILPGTTIKNFGTALVTALVLGLVNTFVRPLLVLFTIPITIITFGLFLLVINTLMVQLTSAIVPGFKVKDFGNAFLFAIVLTIINWTFYYLLGY